MIVHLVARVFPLVIHGPRRPSLCGAVVVRTGFDPETDPRFDDAAGKPVGHGSSNPKHANCKACLATVRTPTIQGVAPPAQEQRKPSGKYSFTANARRV